MAEEMLMDKVAKSYAENITAQQKANAINRAYWMNAGVGWTGPDGRVSTLPYWAARLLTGYQDVKKGTGLDGQVNAADIPVPVGWNPALERQYLQNFAQPEGGLPDTLLGSPTWTPGPNAKLPYNDLNSYDMGNGRYWNDPNAPYRPPQRGAVWGQGPNGMPYNGGVSGSPVSQWGLDGGGNFLDLVGIAPTSVAVPIGSGAGNSLSQGRINPQNNVSAWGMGGPSPWEPMGAFTSNWLSGAPMSAYTRRLLTRNGLLAPMEQASAEAGQAVLNNRGGWGANAAAGLTGSSGAAAGITPGGAKRAPSWRTVTQV